MKKAFLALLAALMAFAFVSCGGKEEAAEVAMVKEPVEFRLNNGAEPESLDPHLIQGVPEHRIYEALFEGLITYNPEDASPLPGVAESWEASNGGTTYTFKIREGLVWTDGVKIDANTVVDSWIRMLDPATGSNYAWFPNMFIKGAEAFNSGEAGADSVQIRALDDMTFQMDLLGPLPYVIGALAHYSFGIVPMHAIEKFGNDWTKPENFVGNGPYVLESWVPQDKITVVPNDKYWDAEAVKLDRVVYLPIEDQNTSHNMYLNGEIDWDTTAPQDQIEQIQFRDDYHATPQLGTYYYVFQNEKKPFDDPRVRKALSMGFNRKNLVEKITKAGQIPAYSMVPDMAGYPAISGNFEDFDEAKKLLAEAGYPGGEGFPAFEILYNTSEGHKKIAEYIQSEWKNNLGIDVSLLNQEWATYLSTRNMGDFQVARAGWIGDYQDPNTFLDMFITGTPMNGGKYSNPKYDELISKAATMPDGPERMSVLADAEKIFILEDMGVMPIYYYVTINMIDLNKWGGFNFNVLDTHPPKDIYLK
ncbi:peptide ABC transporter substrate-binding protein [Spirochaeta isovalerica]|uniref:Oligopeptide transport system substrate-binding protein n=1 Tax=Spirochaeta isovalerica TaxID=150 RepID=A0A841R7A6_9SPIO|nr:peptide ABC transporter substrate-binding protein [Spirochaeta isovalerica]MBB6481134.1 oligopeptide transport system substrate-binding protein [Spirochaeta isovalerica]